MCRVLSVDEGAVQMDSFDARDAFQKHRHDMLNHLQLVKGYQQLNRPDRAVAAVDACAKWLVSLSVLQTQVPAVFDALLWAASACPHLVVRAHRLDGDAAAGAGIHAAQAATALFWLESAVVEHNIEEFTVIIQPSADCQTLELHVQSSSAMLAVVKTIKVAAANQFPMLRWTGREFE